jgi:mono/diheme cytochrome c family protein
LHFLLNRIVGFLAVRTEPCAEVHLNLNHAVWRASDSSTSLKPCSEIPVPAGGDCMKTLSVIIWIGLAALISYVINHALPSFSPDDKTAFVQGGDAATSAPADAIDWSKGGAAIFNANCSRCHSKKLEREERIPGGDWVYKWIRNSAALIQSGDAYGNEIYARYNKTQMDPFPNLTDAEINLIMEFIAGYQPQ